MRCPHDRQFNRQVVRFSPACGGSLTGLCPARYQQLPLRAAFGAQFATPLAETVPTNTSPPALSQTASDPNWKKCGHLLPRREGTMLIICMPMRLVAVADGNGARLGEARLLRDPGIMVTP
jgi:hypothetical protein